MLHGGETGKTKEGADESTGECFQKRIGNHGRRLGQDVFRRFPVGAYVLHEKFHGIRDVANARFKLPAEAKSSQETHEKAETESKAAG